MLVLFTNNSPHPLPVFKWLFCGKGKGEKEGRKGRERKRKEGKEGRKEEGEKAPQN